MVSQSPDIKTGPESPVRAPASVPVDEAENRLHAQKGILAWCFDAVK